MRRLGGQRLIHVLISLLATFAGGTMAHAQTRSAYEYDPYRVQVWIAVSASPALPADAANDLTAAVTARLDTIFGATWQVVGDACPPALSRRIASELASITVEDLLSVDPALLEHDKLFAVGIEAEEAGMRVVARELDLRSRTWSETIERDATQRANLTEAATSAVVAAFSPIVRIELVDGSRAVARLRAGGLIETPNHPAAIEPGTLLQPVLRSNDRYGEPRKGGIQRLPYTFLEVMERKGHRVECLVHSGVRGALGGRGSRMERLALVVQPHVRGTRLVLQDKAQPPQPLVGYEVLSRPTAGQSELASLGMTDLHGSIVIPLAKEHIQWVYVRHGQQMLARVPVIPGLVPEQMLTLTNDDGRLAAEGYFLAVQNQVLDLVAQREVLAARIRLRIDQRELDQAQKLLDELRGLTTRADLLRDIEQQQARFATSDAALQAKVTKLFVELRKFLTNHLEPKLIDDLTAELRAARRS